MDTLTYQHDYWRDRERGDNSPATYGDADIARSAFLTSLMDRHAHAKTSRVLELGCNCCRNLWHLQEAGYSQLTGVDINQLALDARRHYFPTLSASVACDTIEHYMETVGPDVVDVAYSMAVLMHIHPDSEQVFDNIANAARQTIITIENEYDNGSRWHSRNYQDIFEDRGWLQIEHVHPIPIRDIHITPHYVARVFKPAHGVHDA